MSPTSILTTEINNSAGCNIIELAAGTYYLDDDLTIDRRLVLRGAAGTTPDQVVIDGGMAWNGAQIDFVGYYIDMQNAASMIDGVTLTHLGASPIDFAADHSAPWDLITGYSIAVRGGTINRSIIIDNISNYYTDVYDCIFGGGVIGIFDGTLSGSLIAHNGWHGTGFQASGCGGSYANYVGGTKGVITASGTSHLVGNTIVNNIGANYSEYLPSASGNVQDPWFKTTSAKGVVNLWDDPILENNVIVGNNNLYYDYAAGEPIQVTMNFRQMVDALEPAFVNYRDNWIHKSTENNYIDASGSGLFANNPGSIGALTSQAAVSPAFDYAPVSSLLVDAGTDVFYPVIPKDLNGNPHYLGNTPDLGAYESADVTPNFTQYPGGIVYVTEGGAGDESGTSWSNAMDGNGRGGPQSALIAAVRGGAHQIWFATGDYDVPNRELLYTRQMSHNYVDDNLVAGVWAGLLMAPVLDGGNNDMKIMGGFSGVETTPDGRNYYPYVDDGTEIGPRLCGVDQSNNTHFRAERGLTPLPAQTSQNGNTKLAFVDVQPDYLNLVNNDPSYRLSTTPTLLPSMGVSVIGLAEFGRYGATDGDYTPYIDCAEISNGMTAIHNATNYNGSGDVFLDKYLAGGAGIFIQGGTINNVYVHDNYDAVANYVAFFLSCGGGIFATATNISNAVVTDNVSETTGGGILANRSNVLQSYVADNYAFKAGGGIHTGTVGVGGGTAASAITNTVIANNHTVADTSIDPYDIFGETTGDGGGLWMSAANPTNVRDVTLYGNTTSDATGSGLGGNIYFAGGELVNVAGLGAGSATYNPIGAVSTGTDIFVADVSKIDNITYSAFGVVDGEGGSLALGPTNLVNLSGNGVFVDVATRNYRPVDGSPLIGSGVKISGVDNDIDGSPRKSADIGAYADTMTDEGVDQGGSGPDHPSSPDVPVIPGAPDTGTADTGSALALLVVAILVVWSVVIIRERRQRTILPTVGSPVAPKINPEPAKTSLIYRSGASTEFDA